MKHPTAVEHIQLSFNDPEIIPDPYPVYQALRARSPACFLPLFDGAWLFFGYDDVRELLCDERLSSYRTNLPLRALPPSQRPRGLEMADILDR